MLIRRSQLNNINSIFHKGLNRRQSLNILNSPVSNNRSNMLAVNLDILL